MKYEVVPLRRTVNNILLTPTEWEIFEALVKSPKPIRQVTFMIDKIYTTDQESYTVHTPLLRLHIKNLRTKGIIITNIPGHGYILEKDEGVSYF